MTSGKVQSCGCLQKEKFSKYASENAHCTNYNYDWYFIKNNIKVKCDSSYEVMYANYLIKNNINFEYHNKTFKLKDGMRYTPDFYLTDTDEYIEIKGSYWEKENQEKIESIKDLIDVKLTFVRWEDIKTIANIPYCQSSGVIRASKRVGEKPEDYIAQSKYLKQLK